MNKIENTFFSSFKLSGFRFGIYSSRKGIKKININKKNWTGPPEATKLYPDDPLMFNIYSQLDEYFNSSRKQFDIPLDIEGTDFQRQVWREISRIPFGKTAAYKEIALKTCGAAAVRAVGRAAGANPVPIIIPCHRVINVSGKIGGYSAGLDVKERLLEHEGIMSMELLFEVRRSPIELIEE